MAGTARRPQGGDSPSAEAPAKTRKPKAAKPSAPPAELPVRDGEDPWTAEELAEVHQTLGADVERMRREIAEAESLIADTLRDSGEGSGDDQADVGSKNFEREHELSVARNARDLLAQSERALLRIGDGTYGACEICGLAVGKMRLQAFPRATLCVTCKAREERR